MSLQGHFAQISDTLVGGMRVFDQFFFLGEFIMRGLLPMWKICEEQGITEDMMWESWQKSEHFHMYPTREAWRERQIQNGIIQKTKRPHSFITVSLPADNYSSNFAPEVAKCLERNASVLNGNNYVYSLEFFGKDLDKLHPHFHLLIKGGGLDKSKIIRAFSRHFKLEKNFIDVKRSEDEGLYIKRENYIKGIKQDKKQDAINKDDEFRKKHNIEKFYSNDTI